MQCSLFEEFVYGIKSVRRLRVFGGAVVSSGGGAPKSGWDGGNCSGAAIGIVAGGVLSGIQANVFTQGVFQISSGMADYSGNLGLALYVGRSGQIVSTSGSFNSGGFTSGDIWQRIGIPFNSGGVVINMSEAFKLASG